MRRADFTHRPVTPKPKKPVPVYHTSFWLGATREAFTAKAEAHFAVDPPRNGLGVSLVPVQRNGGT